MATFHIDLDYILKHSVRPTEEYVEQKIVFEQRVRARELTESDMVVKRYDREFALIEDTLPAIGRIARATNRPKVAISRVLDKIEDYEYYKYLGL